MIDDNGGEYSNESNDNMTARASGETVTESQNKKVSVFVFFFVFVLQ